MIHLLMNPIPMLILVLFRRPINDNKFGFFTFNDYLVFDTVRKNDEIFRFKNIFFTRCRRRDS